MKKKWALCAAVSLLLGLCACAAPEQATEDYHIDFYDPSEGIYTVSDLLDFFANGETHTASLGCSLDLGGEMLKLGARRGAVTLNGNGNSITSSADCVIRIDDGGSLVLNDVAINAGADGVGCMGDATLGGKGLAIDALTNAVHSTGDVTILAQSDMSLIASKGSGIIAKSLVVENGAKVVAAGGQSAVLASKNDLTLAEGAQLSAQTSSYYNAVKCAGVLRLMDGSVFEVRNLGEYHGAELDGIAIEGAVTIQADGGDKGVGIFLFDLHDDITVVGHCTPAPRFESGNGSLSFVESAAAIPASVAEPVTPETEDENGTDAA